MSQSEDPVRSWSEMGSDELLAAVQEEGEKLDLPALRSILRSPFLDEQVVEVLLEVPGLRGAYEVRSLLAASPRTPLPWALQLVPGLYWRDLLELSRNVQVPPVVRRSAERYLAERLPAMALGEKVALARLATGRVLARVRADPNPRVISALLENPRLTEGTLMPLVVSDSTSPAVLRLVADNPRWGLRYPVRAALSRNPKTPVDVALRLLSGLKRGDRRAVANRPGLAPAVRRRARLLLGDDAV